MTGAWRRVVVVSGVIVVVALAVLEIAASHLQVNQSLTVAGAPSRSEDPAPWQDSLNAQGRALGSELGPSVDLEASETAPSAGEHVAVADSR